jgi:hypothetical protein
MLPSVLRNPDNLPAATGLLYQFAAIGTMAGAPLYLSLAGVAHASMALIVLTCGATTAVALVVPASRGARAAGTPLTAATTSREVR